MTSDEMNKAAAEMDGWELREYGDGDGLLGWTAPGRKYRPGIWRTYYNDDELPKYATDSEATKSLISKTCTTPELRAKFMNALHKLTEPLCPKNNVGHHVVSDFDKLTAPTELWLKALLIATGKIRSKPNADELLEALGKTKR